LVKQNSISAKTVGNPFAALRHKNFLLFWTGMAISTMGMWMQSTAQPWLALRLTDSAFLLSLVSALQFAPVLVLTLFAGVLVDRFPKKTILLITQTASLVITLILAVLDITGRVTYWHLIVTSTLTGIVNAFDMPARQSIVIELVGREDLTNGIALNSVQYNMARIAGPALAGVIMAAWGTSVCFLLNAASFLAVIGALILIKPLPLEKSKQEKRGIFRNIGDGLVFIFKRPQLYMPLLFIAIAATFAMNFSVTIPLFAKQVLLLEETGYGFLMSATGIGALAGALAMAALSRGGPRDAYIYVFPIIVGALLVGTGLSGQAVVAAVILAVISFFYMIFMSSVNTTLQSGATDEFRGRVVSVYSLVVSGSTPLGNLFAGAVSERFGARAGFTICGALIVVLLLALLALQKRKTEPET
jgi:MFS family permease